MKKHTIQVRHYFNGTTAYSMVPEFEVVNTIKRTLRAEQMGNFNPIFCTYKGKEELVHSDEGDLSDPFRCEESYLECLFITV